MFAGVVAAGERLIEIVECEVWVRVSDGRVL